MSIIYRVNNIGFTILGSTVRITRFDQANEIIDVKDFQIKLIDARFTYAIHKSNKYYIECLDCDNKFGKLTDVFVRSLYYDIENSNITYLMPEIYFISDRVIRINLAKNVVEDITSKIDTYIDLALKYGIEKEPVFTFKQWLQGGLVPVIRASSYDARFEEELIRLFPNPDMIELYQQLEQFEKENRYKFLEICKNIEVYDPTTNTFVRKDISKEVERIMRKKNLL